MRISGRLHHDPNAAGEAGGIREPRGPGARRLALRAAPWAVLALVLAVAGSAGAHSLPLESSPGPGAVLPPAPRALSLRFNNRVEKNLSPIRLRDQRGGLTPVN